MEQWVLIALFIAIVPVAIFLSVQRIRRERSLLRQLWKALTGK
jgi:uncharacterized membrane protein